MTDSANVLPSGSIPDGWARYEASGVPYYHNAALGITQWEFPHETTTPETTANSSSDLENGSGNIGGPGSNSNPIFFFSNPLDLVSMETNKESFNITTSDVLRRLLAAVLPYKAVTALDETSEFRSKPDIYGPFWIAMTLCSALFISTNTFLWASSSANSVAPANFRVLIVAFFQVFSFWIGIPGLLRLLLWAYGDLSLLPIGETLCVVGYSFWMAVPLTILCAVPVKSFQYVLAGMGLLWSFVFIGINFLRDLKASKMTIRYSIIGFVGVALLAFYITIPLYYFKAPKAPVVVLSSAPAPVSHNLTAHNLAHNISKNAFAMFTTTVGLAPGE